MRWPFRRKRSEPPQVTIHIHAPLDRKQFVDQIGAVIAKKARRAAR